MFKGLFNQVFLTINLSKNPVNLVIKLERGPRRCPIWLMIIKSLISSAFVKPSKIRYTNGNIISDIISPNIVLGINKRPNPNMKEAIVTLNRLKYGNFVLVTLIVVTVVRTITMKEAIIVAIAAPFKPYIGTNNIVKAKFVTVPIAKKYIAG